MTDWGIIGFPAASAYGPNPIYGPVAASEIFVGLVKIFVTQLPEAPATVQPLPPVTAQFFARGYFGDGVATIEATLRGKAAPGSGRAAHSEIVKEEIEKYLCEEGIKF